MPVAMSSKQAEAADDGKLALLASILEPSVIPLTRLSQALKDSKGDVGRAAESLLLDHGDSQDTELRQATAGNKGPRKNGNQGDGSIANWLGKRKRIDAGSTPEHDEPSFKLEPELAIAPPCTPPKPELEKLDRPPVDLMKLLRQPPPSSKAPPRPAVHLASQSAIDARSVPFSFLPSPLSPALASALYLTMMRESESWEKHQWYLAGRWVESPHLMSGYQRTETDKTGEGGPLKDPRGSSTIMEPGLGSESEPTPAYEPTKGSATAGTSAPGPDDDAHYYYSGAELSKDKPYPPLLSHVASLIEPLVNAHLASRPRYRLEYAGEWKANRCGANRYDGAASGVGWHADQLTYLGPYCTIASLSLGTSRRFRVRETKETRSDGAGPSGPTSGAGEADKEIRTYEVTLGHNSLVLMDPGCQERFKHTIPPQKALDIFRPTFDIDQCHIPGDEQKGYTSRINITFRFYRPDFHPIAGVGPFGPRDATPVCKCGIPALLRADQKARARINQRNSPRKRPHKEEIASPRRVKLESESSKRASPTHDRSAKEASDGDLKQGLDSKPSEASSEMDTAANDLHQSSTPKTEIRSDDMAFFWQCQSPGQTGDLKGCGFFRMLDMQAEGRGPCVVD